MFAELFNEMLQRDFGYRIYRALIAISNKDEKKEKKDKARKDVDRKEADRRDIKKEKEDENAEPVSKRSREEDDKRRVSGCYMLHFVLTSTSAQNQSEKEFMQILEFIVY